MGIQSCEQTRGFLNMTCDIEFYSVEHFMLLSINNEHNTKFLRTGVNFQIIVNWCIPSASTQSFGHSGP